MSSLQDIQAHLSLSRPFSLGIIALVAIISIVAIRRTRINSTFSSIPVFASTSTSTASPRRQWMFESIKLLQDGYRKYRGRAFQVWTTEGYQISIPPEFVDDLKLLPDHTLPSALRNFFLHEYVWPIDEAKLDYGHVVLRNDLNKSMNTILPNIRDELDRVILQEIPATSDWQPVKVHPKMSRLVTRLNSKVFVGDELCDDEEWININSKYARVIFMSSAKLRFFPSWLRPVAQYFISELREVRRCNFRAKQLIAPVLQKRELAANDEKTPKSKDAIDWLRDIAPETDKNDAHFHAISQLGISAVSVNTSSQLLTNTLFNLAVLPEYADILRDEIAGVLSVHEEGINVDSLAKMQKLDSFLKETLRYNGHLTATFQRNVRRSVQLRDGTTVPAGSVLFAPTNAINFDPEIYPNPDTFDGLRFYRLRQASADSAGRFQLTSITNTQLQFGSGRHACPGRWFASHEIKLVLISILSRYDVKLKAGEDRPKGIVFQTNQLPNPAAEVLFRVRD